MNALLRDLEVTPAMIDAGVLELVRYDQRFEDPQDSIVKIYKAMESAKSAGRQAMVPSGLSLDRQENNDKPRCNARAVR